MPINLCLKDKLFYLIFLTIQLFKLSFQSFHPLKLHVVSKIRFQSASSKRQRKPQSLSISKPQVLVFYNVFPVIRGTLMVQRCNHWQISIHANIQKILQSNVQRLREGQGFWDLPFCASSIDRRWCLNILAQFGLGRFRTGPCDP